MQITVHLFAAHREAVGSPLMTLSVPEGTTAGEVWRLLAQQHPALLKAAAPTAVAVNDAVAPGDRPLRDGDHVALLAPVSGGQRPEVTVPHVELVLDPISLDALLG
ncbi:MAG: MoaD/ThiS family protein, partial [Firmicutes bacterium]|nr:MoaD/ThiS family protein [Bacillota bacterium]